MSATHCRHQSSWIMRKANKRSCQHSKDVFNWDVNQLQRRAFTYCYNVIFIVINLLQSTFDILYPTVVELVI